MRTLNFDRSPATLAALVVVMLFAAFMHLYCLTSYPPGLDSDAARDGLDVLKLIRHGVLPFYITINSNADPLFIYTASAATRFLGERIISMRLTSAFYSLLGLATIYICLVELGHDSFDRPTRRQIAIAAVTVLAASQMYALINRMGLRFSTQTVFQMAAIWALARALRAGHRGWWIAAGVLAGLTQYTYPSARVLPLLLFLILLLKLPRQWWKDKAFFAGLGLYLASAVAALLPQIIWYANYPATFLARAGQTSITQNPLYEKVGLFGVLLDKFSKYGLALGTEWLGQYNQIKEPLLSPLFYYGFMLGVGAGLIWFRRRFVSLAVCGLLVMILPDLISGDRDWPHELRLIGAYPFVAGIAGLGLIGLHGLFRRWPGASRVAGLTLAAAIALTMVSQAREFFSPGLNYDKFYWSGNIWLKRIDAGTAAMIVNSSDSYLLPASNYGQTVIKYLTANRALEVRSAVDGSGRLLPVLQHGAKIFLPLQSDGAPWQGEVNQQWVLFEGKAAYILPPIPNIASFVPSQNQSTLVYGAGIESIVQIGHIGEVESEQLALAESYAPELPEHICFANGVCLVGVSYSDRHLKPGGQLRVYLYWRATGQVKEDYILYLHLLDRDGNALTGVDGYPVGEGYRTYEWRQDETVITQHTLQLPADLPVGPYGIEAGFYPPYQLSLVKTIDDSGSVTGDRAYVIHLKVPRPAVQLPADYQTAGIKFADEVELVGYRMDTPLSAGEPLRLTLWWRGLQPATQDWVAFFHLTPADDGATLIGQLDRRITDGAYPPLLWDGGELIEEQIEVAAADVQPGAYALWLGLYSPLTFERLPITHGPSAVEDNRTMLLRFEVQP